MKKKNKIAVEMGKLSAAKRTDTKDRQFFVDMANASWTPARRAKLAQKPKEFYQEMNRRSLEARRAKKEKLHRELNEK